MATWLHIEPLFTANSSYLHGVLIGILHYRCINPLPNDKILDMTKLKAFADDKLTHSHTMTPLDASGKQAF